MNRVIRRSAVECFAASCFVTALVGGVLFAAGCVSPRGGPRQFSKLSAVEKAAALQLFDTYVAQTERLRRVAFPLRRAALEMCPESNITPVWGASIAVTEMLPELYRHGALMRYSLTDRPMFLFITPGGPMDLAGVRAGDVVLRVNGLDVSGPGGVREVSELLDRSEVALLVLLRGEERLLVEVASTLVCGGEALVVTSSSINAYIHGYRTPAVSIYVTSRMLDYVPSDEELALIVSHALGHIIGGDPVYWKKGIADRIGAEVLAAGYVDSGQLSGLVSLHHRWAGWISGRGPGRAEKDRNRKFSEDAELRADRIGAEILAAANVDFGEAIDFWKRMSAESPESIAALHGARHPSTPERFVQLRELHARLFGPSRTPPD